MAEWSRRLSVACGQLIRGRVVSCALRGSNPRAIIFITRWYGRVVKAPHSPWLIGHGHNGGRARQGSNPCIIALFYYSFYYFEHSKLFIFLFFINMSASMYFEDSSNQKSINSERNTLLQSLFLFLFPLLLSPSLYCRQVKESGMTISNKYPFDPGGHFRRFQSGRGRRRPAFVLWHQHLRTTDSTSALGRLGWLMPLCAWYIIGSALT